MCVQYIFSSFAGQLDISNKYLISAYKNYDQKTAQTILNEWFNSGKHTKEEFAKKYNLTIDEAVEQEFLSHKNWKETHRLALTPTILVNGYKLPINYKIEDLRYFSKLD